MAVINVPKTPAKAYNPQRPPGKLIQNQITHLEWAIRPAAERKHGKFRVKPAKTEAEAAARIQALTHELTRQGKAAKKAAARRAPTPKTGTTSPRAKSK